MDSPVRSRDFDVCWLGWAGCEGTLEVAARDLQISYHEEDYYLLKVRASKTGGPDRMSFGAGNVDVRL